MDCWRMFEQANSFYAFAMLGSKEAEKDPMCNVYFSAPQIVNLALACEIYLKTLLACAGITIREHRLSTLLRKVPEDYQNKINTLLYQRYPITQNAFGYPHIELLSNAFTEWRYSYEAKSLSCDISYLKAFAETLRDVCCSEVHGMSWAEYCKIYEINSDLWGCKDGKTD